MNRPKYTPENGFLLDKPLPRIEPKSRFLLELEARQARAQPKLPESSTVRYLSNPRRPLP